MWLPHVEFRAKAARNSQSRIDNLACDICYEYQWLDKMLLVKCVNVTVS